MTPEEAKARVARDNAELAALEADVARLAQQYGAPVFLAIMRVLVEMVCRSMGPNFVEYQKRKFYEAVLGLLRAKGIS